MGCVRRVTGEALMNEEEFATWEKQSELREVGKPFIDVLRRELASQLRVRNFRRLALVYGERVLARQDPWMTAELVVVVRPYVNAQTGAGEGEVTQLLMAARDGDAARLVALLDSPQDPNISDDSGNAALHVASECGYADLVFPFQSLLLNAQANYNGDAPIHKAAHQGHKEVLRILIPGNQVVFGIFMGTRLVACAGVPLTKDLPFGGDLWDDDMDLIGEVAGGAFENQGPRLALNSQEIFQTIRFRAAGRGTEYYRAVEQWKLQIAAFMPQSEAAIMQYTSLQREEEAEHLDLQKVIYQKRKLLADFESTGVDAIYDGDAQDELDFGDAARDGGAEDGDAEGDTENPEAAATSSLAAKGRQTTYWDLRDLAIAADGATDRDSFANHFLGEIILDIPAHQVGDISLYDTDKRSLVNVKSIQEYVNQRRTRCRRPRQNKLLRDQLQETRSWLQLCGPWQLRLRCATYATILPLHLQSWAVPSLVKVVNQKVDGKCRGGHIVVIAINEQNVHWW
ncbi:unnamed protein product [Effrenium voratum]|uniref:Uncharacterized protein n=1 Tax=Effrenium voratum TaxID=2562239 RepID=A0AA36IYE2_9DINO|nr:unnamed protein product [Effrenium voratum]